MESRFSKGKDEPKQNSEEEKDKSSDSGTKIIIRLRAGAMWTEDENDLLRELVQKYNRRKWVLVSQYFKGKTGKQCRERWYNHLDESQRRGGFTLEEDKYLYSLYQKHGNNWTKVARESNGRSDNQVKQRCINYKKILLRNKSFGTDKN